ncbi:MAG: M14 family zinc carboxypeptidase [Hungatella sp.]
MKKILSIVLGSVLLVVNAWNPTYAEAAKGPGLGLGDSYTYKAPIEIGPGVSVTEGENDFFQREVSNPIVKRTDRYSYDQMAADIQALQAVYGDKMQVNVIGTSLDGRNIYDIIVGNPSAGKHIMIQGSIHAREYITTLLMMEQMEFALANYDTGHYNRKPLSEMFLQTAVHFVPMSNPDGVSLSQFGIDAIRSESLRQGIRIAYDKDVAKERVSDPFEVYLTKWKNNAGGVDLNHNFETAWNSITGVADFPSYAGYKGTWPLSEPETQALAGMANRYPWAATISYHAMGEVIYWNADTSIKKLESLNLAQSLAMMNGYALDGSDGKGGYKDWMQSRTGAVPSVTIEVGKEVCPVSFAQYPTIWAQNKGVWVQAMDYVMKH